MQIAELLDAWPTLEPDEQLEGFRELTREDAEAFFASLAARDAADLLLTLPVVERKTWMRLMAPDDVADIVQEVDDHERANLLALLDEVMRKEVAVLLAYAEDDAGGLMSTRFARVRADLRVDEALLYLRRQAREKLETIYYVYALDHEQRLLGVATLRALFTARSDATVRDVMKQDVVTVSEDMDQEAVSRLFKHYGFLAVPVVDAERRMKGIVTVDDIVDVLSEEATEDAQKFGGMEALDEPYLEIAFWDMWKKRAGWLSALFLGEMLTATAMGRFQDEIAKAVVLALFVPLIISSGGNSGSQASTLVIRAMALGELRMRDGFRVARREIAAGLALGTTLGVIGVIRIVAWEKVFHTYGAHYLEIAITVGVSLVGVVLFGTMAGSMLPLLLHRLGFDPASASAPFVATLVDVTGLVLYFTVANLVLGGTLL
jgi:magnesium transporter